MKKGFTLIELLAVIVILAIIALIATPIILGIINDAREKANERSVELYASAIKNGIASHQLRTGEEVLPGTYNETNKLPFEPEYDGKVDCENVIISGTGKVSLDKCTVNNGEKTYNYGMEEDETPDNGETPDSSSTQVYKPQYYSWSSGNAGGDLPSDAKTTVAELNPSYPLYLGLDVEDGKVSAAYVCFKREGNDTEYCLKGEQQEEKKASTYETNKTVLEEAFGASACSFGDSYSHCNAFGVNANSNGYVTVRDYYAYCDVNADGGFVCSEW